MPPEAADTTKNLSTQQLHHPHREGHLLEGVSFIEVEPSLHGHDRGSRPGCPAGGVPRGSPR